MNDSQEVVGNKYSGLEFVVQFLKFQLFEESQTNQNNHKAFITCRFLGCLCLWQISQQMNPTRLRADVIYIFKLLRSS